jgi:antitoxin (DNA-binding transcriptional repressor) of toxin-antitoxin stability system
MKTVTFTDFRKRASIIPKELKHGETIVIFRCGRPIAELIPFSDRELQTPSRKRPGIGLQIQGSDLSSAILEERESES